MTPDSLVSVAAVGAVLLVAWYSARAHRRTTLDAQRAAARATALVQVMTAVERSGTAIQGRIFNWTVARTDPDPRVIPGNRDPYAPLPAREVDVQPGELEEATSLMAAHGDTALDSVYETWLAAHQGFYEHAFVAVDMALNEDGALPTAPQLEPYRLAELQSRHALRAAIRAALRVTRR